ncbi:Uncharacterized protein ehr_00732 [Ehrlichia minasensis]|nr:Uncharacterized protein ehr_00732 [Ehrlichia minasensis]
MELILLFEQGVPVLYPANVCSYDKSENSYKVDYPTLDLSMNVTPPGDNVPLHRLYGSTFTRYCIISSTSLPVCIYCLYGMTRGGGEKVFVIFGLESNVLGDFIERGTVLDDERLITGGFVHNDNTVEQNTRNLFSEFSNYMHIKSDNNTSRTYRLDFFNDSGELFDVVYKDTQLQQVIVNPVTGAQQYVMHL